MNDQDKAEWPIETVSRDIDPKFIFLLAPMNSGSTAIAKTFTNSANVGALTYNAEGQWLIRGMCAPDRWNLAKFIDEESLRTVWSKKCIEIMDRDGAEYFIEKSPPNMVRLDLLQRLFPNNIVLASNRNPYANISSIFHRYTPNIATMDADQRRQKFRQISSRWVMISGYLQHIVSSRNLPYFSYEDFCRDPSLLQGIIDGSDFSDRISLRFDKPVKVKDYDPQGIHNYNEKQISLLEEEDVEQITDVLKRDEGLLEFFNYELGKF